MFIQIMTSFPFLPFQFDTENVEETKELVTSGPFLINL